MIDLRLGRWQDVLAEVADGSVRLILTSPPYDDAREYEGTNKPVDFGDLARFCLRVLMPGGTLAMVLDGAVNDGRQSVTHMETVVGWSKLAGWRFSQELSYGRQGAPGEYRGRFRKDREPLYVFVRNGAEQVCVKDRIAEKSVRSHAPGGQVRQRDGSKRDRNSISTDAFERKHRGSIWWYGSLGHDHDPSSSTGHPAPFAEAFALDAVTVWSNPDDLVLDPFSGSGTVAVACRGLGRRFVGAERVAAYHEIALRRLDPTYISPERAAEPVGPLFGAT